MWATLASAQLLFYLPPVFHLTLPLFWSVCHQAEQLGDFPVDRHVPKHRYNLKNSRPTLTWEWKDNSKQIWSHKKNEWCKKPIVHMWIWIYSIDRTLHVCLYVHQLYTCDYNCIPVKLKSSPTALPQYEEDTEKIVTHNLPSLKKIAPTLEHLLPCKVMGLDCC